MRGKDEIRGERSRLLRQNATRAESLLWRRLRNRQLGQFKFVRQAPIGLYTVDFVCRERKLIVEVDGGRHAESVRDRARDAALGDLGYRVVRFWHNEVIENIEGVLENLQSELEKPLTRTLSQLAGRGG